MSILKVNTVNLQGTAGSTDNTIRFNDATHQFEMYVSGFWVAQKANFNSIVGKTRTTFGYYAGNQTWIVPAGVHFIYAKLWGAGGAGGGVTNTNTAWTTGGTGGAGGHTRGIIPVTPGESLGIQVGGGGVGVTGYFPGGGASPSNYSGAGGAYTGIFRGNPTLGTQLLMAGGGGGGGGSRAGQGNTGGEGGGFEGGDGASPYNGQGALKGGGGTQTGGGGGTSGTGSQWTGGVSPNHGGGGGGGWFGGSAGLYAEPDTMAGGGGGSGFIDNSVIYGETFRGAARIPFASDDPDLIGSNTNTAVRAGFGGTPNMYSSGGSGTGKSAGGNGLMVLYY